MGRKATGRVVLCFSTMGSVKTEEAEAAAKKANASGLIFAEPMTELIAEVDLIPTVRIDIAQGTQLRDYLAQFPR